MGGPPSILGSSATPTQKTLPYNNSVATSRTSFDRGDGLQPAGPGARTISSSNVSFAPRGSSLAPSPAPGSFSSNMRNAMGSRQGSGNDVNASMRELGRFEQDAVGMQEQL